MVRTEVKISMKKKYSAEKSITYCCIKYTSRCAGFDLTHKCNDHSIKSQSKFQYLGIDINQNLFLEFRAYFMIK